MSIHLIFKEPRRIRATENAAPVALIGHSVFVNRYGSNASVIGRAVRINDVPATIIGVMPEGVKFPFNTDVWLPLSTVQGSRNDTLIWSWSPVSPGTRSWLLVNAMTFGSTRTFPIWTIAPTSTPP